MRSLKAITAAILMSVGVLSLSSPAEAGWGCGSGCGWGPGLVGFGVGALVGSALWAPRVYAGPPPPPPVYGPAAYGPPAWSPAWYNYCAQHYRSFNPHTGYFIGPDGQPYFCR
jgi:hypothetical protein